MFCNTAASARIYGTNQIAAESPRAAIEKDMQIPGQSIKMTIRLEGLNSTQVDNLHKAAEKAKTKTLEWGGYTTHQEPGSPIKYITIEEACMTGGSGLYTVSLTVEPVLLGSICSPPEGKDQRLALVFPSREGLGIIFDAVNILPPEDIIEYTNRDKPIPRFGYGS
jgi:hypothetical protein